MEWASEQRDGSLADAAPALRFLRRRFANWTTCNRGGPAPIRRPSLRTAALQTPGICAASERAILQQCSAAYSKTLDKQCCTACSPAIDYL